MLDPEQAQDIVLSAIAEAGGRLPTSGAEALRGLNLREDEQMDRLVDNVVRGVRSLQHTIDPAHVSTLKNAVTVMELTNRVLQLSAGKLCSNPANPHPQKCCPYPAVCPECGAKVN